MFQVISKEEAKRNQKELDDWIMSLDYNTKHHIKEIIVPFIKQNNCFHEWVDPNSYENELDKTKVFCRHCNLKKDLNYLNVSKWLNEATEIYNSKTTMFKIDVQTLINFSKLPEDELCKLYKLKISSVELADFVIFNHLSLVESSNKEIQDKNNLFLKNFETSGIIEKIKDILKFGDTKINFQHKKKRK